MRFKFITVPVYDSENAEKALNEFCLQHRVVHIERQLIADGLNSFWAVCIQWQEGEVAPSATNNRQPTVDYKKILNEKEFDHYLELRNFRKELAESASVPPYALFTNQQLANMIQQQVKNKVGLEKIQGVGKARIEKYGDAFLEKLNELKGSNSITDKDEKKAD